ncbi:MAG: type VI secretion system baseplate subunit TssF, partial [Beijerinckiaceae bacterium]
DFGDARFIPLDVADVMQIGFEPDETLMPSDARMFRGLTLLQEYFTFSRKFLGARINGLRAALAQVKRRSFDLILTFDQAAPRLASAIDARFFALYAAPAVNLFPKTTDRVQVRPNQHEYLVVPDRTQYRQFEVHRILDVFLHYPRRAEKMRVHPLYRARLSSIDDTNEFFYSIRRLPRNRSTEERRSGSMADYLGTDTFLSVSPPVSAVDGSVYPELSLRVICSNRHLAKDLPVGAGGADFKLRDDTSLDIVAAIRPSEPREAPIVWRHDNPHYAGMGPIAWRLINLLSLNHLGLTEEDGRAIRELLALFADVSDPAIEKRIRGLRSIDTRNVIRRFPQRAGVGVARGLEITLTFDDKAFEGSGVFLLGAVLDRVMAEYVALNHFTQTVIQTTERGRIARWPARSGTRNAL